MKDHGIGSPVWIVTQASFLRHCAQVMGGVIDGCDPGPEQDRQYYGGLALEELRRCRQHLIEDVLNTDGPAPGAHSDMRDALSDLAMSRSKHSYSGSSDPRIRKSPWATFSVGIFELLPKARGGTKRSKSKVRVSGSTDNPQLVYDKAQEIVDQLDAGAYTGPKNVRV